MKKQYIELYSFLIGITFIISGIIFTFVNTYKESKKDKIEEETIIADEIGNVYNTFYRKESELSKYRDDLIDNIFDYVTYYSQMPDDYEKMISDIKKYEELVKESEDISSYLKAKCTSKYSIKDANEKCNAYYINLEKTINVFVSDVEFFNSKIKEYNEWIENENESVLVTVEYKKLDEYKSNNYLDYVDLNGDGTYLGMNNN